MAAMKPRTGDGPLEVTKEGRGIVMRVPLEGGGRLVVVAALSAGLVFALGACSADAPRSAAPAATATGRGTRAPSVGADAAAVSAEVTRLLQRRAAALVVAVGLGGVVLAYGSRLFARPPTGPGGPGPSAPTDPAP